MSIFKKKEKRFYHYIVTLDTPVWPRQLSDDLNRSRVGNNVISVTDVQDDSHIYGRTYYPSEHAYEAATGRTWFPFCHIRPEFRPKEWQQPEHISR